MDLKMELNLKKITATARSMTSACQRHMKTFIRAFLRGVKISALCWKTIILTIISTLNGF